MLPKQEFYFVRHGQTDHNILEGNNKADHPLDISLNQKGIEQALEIEPLVALLPIKVICTSGMKRVQETKNIIVSCLQAPHYEIVDLGECSAVVWREMTGLGMYASLPTHGPSFLFVEQVRRGLCQALSYPGPCLIVSHGGVHWVICSLMNITNHGWILENCGLVHFSVDANQKWIATKLM
ncbi:MAG TPA: histidine phosphatase family protein [Rhabdochlamydiaceae bacterium]|jgi:probable phosphoglycerate mutase